MEQIILKKNNLPYDNTWLIEHEGKIVFHTRSGVVLPIIINTLQTPTYQVMEPQNVTRGTMSENPIESHIKKGKIFIVDDSYSMEGGKMNGQKKILKDMIASCAEDVQILVYPLNALRFGSMNLSRTEIMFKIDAIQAQGGTPLYKAIRDICNKTLELAKIEEVKKTVYVFNIIVITDGEAGDNEIINEAKLSYASLMQVDANNIPMFSVDLDFYAARGEGGINTARSIGIPDNQIHEFDNDVSGIENAGHVMRQNEIKDTSRMNQANSKNFKMLSRSRS